MSYTSYFIKTCLAVILVGTMYQYHNIQADRSSFHKDGTATERLKNVFKHVGASIETLVQANEFAQKHLLRAGERWDVQEETEVRKKMQENKDLLIEDLRNLGMVDAIDPAQQSYTYALLMGALKLRVEQRLNYLADLINNGYTFDQIVLLGGERPLRDSEKEGLPADVASEADMMKHLFDNHPTLNKYSVLLVNAPMKQKEDGSMARPTTDDTLVHFMKIAPQDGSCLVVSNNPYTVRQTKTAERVLSQSRFPTEGAGEKANFDTVNIDILMDEFARTVYEEYTQFKKNQASL